MLPLLAFSSQIPIYRIGFPLLNIFFNFYYDKKNGIVFLIHDLYSEIAFIKSQSADLQIMWLAGVGAGTDITSPSLRCMQYHLTKTILNNRTQWRSTSYTRKKGKTYTDLKTSIPESTSDLSQSAVWTAYLSNKNLFQHWKIYYKASFILIGTTFFSYNIVNCT